MFCDQMRASIEAARTPARLEDLARAIWQAWAAQAVSDDDAEQLAGLIAEFTTATQLKASGLADQVQGTREFARRR